MKYKLVGLSSLCGVVLAAMAALALATPAPRVVALDRPALQAQQGHYFRWAAPQGWSVKETTNGVDLASPDGTTLVSSALLHGSFGNMTPRDFLMKVMQQVNPTARIFGSAPLPSQPGIWGPWQSEDFLLSGLHQGTPVRMRATVGLSAGHVATRRR